MERQNTVFVIGAGASRPYGLPTGEELVQMIINESDELSYAFTKLGRLALPIERYQLLAKTLEETCCNSIDQFLEIRSDLDLPGRFAASAILLPREQSATSAIKQDEHWIASIINTYCKSGSLEDFDKTRFIVFNYDRLLELFTMRSLISRFSMTEQDAKNYVNNMQIIHPYGILEGPWGFGNIEKWKRNYSHNNPQIRSQSIQLAANGINIMSEERVDDAVKSRFSTCRDWLRWANRAYFLGFGFDRSNCRRLGILNEQDSLLHRCNFVASTFFGMRPLERNGKLAELGYDPPQKWMDQLVSEGSTRVVERFRSGDESTDCKKLIRDYPPA